MDEEKKTEKIEEIGEKRSENEKVKPEGLDFEKNEINQKPEQTQEKIKQAQDKISSSGSNSVSDDSGDNSEDNSEKQTEEVANLEKVEDQIQKLTEVAMQEGPKKAFKIARDLNSNYALDEMHDRLIDEDELRKALLKKGFIEVLE